MQVALSTQYPSTFTPDGEIISCELSANKKKIVIEVHKKFDTGVVYEYRYTLIFKNKERSEERGVGKEGSIGWRRKHEKKNE